jgi:hypothetical protein
MNINSDEMKYKILILFTFAMLSFSAKAQYFNAGAKLGIVASQVDGDTYSGFDKFGFNMGVFVSYKLSYRTSLQLELEYIQKGSKHNPNYEKNDFDQYKMSLSYIQIPLLLQYKLSQNFSAEIGPAFGVLVSNYEERDHFEISSNPFRNIALSLNTGFVYKVNDSWNVNFRADYSLLGIREKAAPGDRYIWFHYGQFNNSLVLSLQYVINHAKDQ